MSMDQKFYAVLVLGILAVALYVAAAMGVFS